MRIRLGLQLVRLTPVRPTYIDIIFRSKQFRNTSSAILPKIGNLNEIYPHAPRPLVPRVPHASVLPSYASVLPSYASVHPTFPHARWTFPTLDGCLPKRTRTRGTRSFVVSVDLDMGYILQEILKIYKNFFYFFENFSKKKVLKKIIFLF